MSKHDLSTATLAIGRGQTTDFSLSAPRELQREQIQSALIGVGIVKPKPPAPKPPEVPEDVADAWRKIGEDEQQAYLAVGQEGVDRFAQMIRFARDQRAAAERE
ncbi:MAG TPA: hypothetical protein VKZ49_19030 [Polyangiaceae bacterium]|nr:hypothetical protein [Polyangiaceae bacterium]